MIHDDKVPRKDSAKNTTGDNVEVDVEKLRSRMNAIQESGVNLTHAWREKQLKSLLQLMVDNTDSIRDALAKDLGREATEAIAIETKPIENDIRFILANLKDWMQPQAVPSPALLLPARSYVERRPLLSPGVLIIGPYNYPVRMLLQPLAGALAGGNPAVLKPSEQTPAVAALMKQLVDKYFEESGAVAVVLGGVPESNILLRERWGKVFFTGSERVGKVVARACAESLTPTILELGGKCPVIVDETVHSSLIETVAKRIVFAKGINAGQTCIAPDIIFVHETHVEALSNSLKTEMDIQFGEDPKKGELARMVSKTSASRVIQLIKDAETSGGTVIYGGSKLCDENSKYICPTFIVNPDKTSKIRTAEVFGPAAAIVTFKTCEEAINLVRGLRGEPLHLYIFTPNEQRFRQYIDSCAAAGALQNDIIVQGASHQLPFGGIGTSGHGNYFGRFSFDSFSHAYPVMYRPLFVPKILDILRCHPFGNTKGPILERTIFAIPDIPVLHTRRLLPLLGFGFVLYMSPDSQLYVKSMLSRGLRWGLSILED